MKIKVIKSSQPSYWYADKIGEEFEVDDAPTDKGDYTLTHFGNKEFMSHRFVADDIESVDGGVIVKPIEEKIIVAKEKPIEKRVVFEPPTRQTPIHTTKIVNNPKQTNLTLEL